MTRTIVQGAAIAAGLICSVMAYGQANVAGEKTAKDAYGEGQVVAGARLGMADVESLGDMAVTYGAFGDYALSHNLLVGGSIDYWSKSSIAIADEQLEVNDLSFGAGARFIFTRVSAQLRPFAAGGLAMHRFSINRNERNEGVNPEVDAFENADNDVSGEFGVDLGGGLLYRVQRDIDIGGEVRYRKLFDSTVALDQLTFGGALAYNL